MSTLPPPPPRTHPTPRGGKRIVEWLVAAAFALPAFAPLVAHYAGFLREGLHATGFLIYDTPYYMANAREHFDAGRFTFLYSSPFSYDYGSPRIYFQPLTLVLGLLGRLPGADPGIVFGLVGLVAAVVCARIAMALFDRFASRATPSGKLALVAFVWGGGLFVVMGAFFAFLPGTPGSTPGDTFSLSAWWWFTRVADPVGGWWFLNFGRNFVLSTEALYHALFLGSVLLIITRRFAAALGVMAVLATSHPFTGIQFLAIALAWGALELVVRSRVAPWWFVVGTAVLTAVHVGYYLVFLPTFPEHRQLQAQWTLRWTLTVPQTLFAYGVVGGLAIARMRSATHARTVLGHWPNRLLVVWVLVCLALENHELFLPRAIQPVHFTRGYSWIGLFLLGVPLLVGVFDRLLRRGDARPKVLAAAGLLLFLVVDNVVWLGANTAQAVGVQLGRRLPPDSLQLGFALTADQQELFAWMSRPENERAVVLSEDETVGYLLTVYTPLRSWRSHYANTPWNRQRLDELRAFFRSGTMVDAWRRLPMLVVFENSANWRERMAGFATVPLDSAFANASYTVVRAGSTLRATAAVPHSRAASLATRPRAAPATPAPDPR